MMPTEHANNFSFISRQLAEQQQLNRYRQRVCIGAGVTNEHNCTINIAGKHYINFSSNDYLGLNNHAEINKALQEGADKFGTCASASSLVTGYHYVHQALEDEICQWLNKPRCLLFSSGFSANLALFHALGQQGDTQSSNTSQAQFYLDKLSHASMIDGAYQSNAKVKRFNHNNTEQLARLLEQNNAENTLIASEGVFSMDGDQAKVAQLAQLAKQHNAWLYLDDAHSIGVIGEQGQGSNSITDIDITMATFGKAMATSGAFLTCQAELHDYLINFSRHYIYSTAISPAIAWATIKSIKLIKQAQWRRDKINELSALFTRLLADNIQLITSQSSIHAIIIGDEKAALQVSEKLKQQGIWLTAIRPPTVAVNSSRLRVTICAHHNENDIKYLAECLNKALK
ncbi:8-amino-7-oxononanoate synthase [Colwellia sp. D2M02]|uniref:aminotransferase class I/II-fold pyridoxal phosphate-dependent enzyme n=1 Tax=Colwellia sp. D2M02 TaxID=2841562 RepID=UPI0020916370|nr:8-amino-7-oxononanoate synthase [Colwellia sp. D2M02]